VLIVLMVMMMIGSAIFVSVKNSGRTNYPQPTYGNPYYKPGLNPLPQGPGTDKKPLAATPQVHIEVSDFMNQFSQLLAMKNGDCIKFFDLVILQAAATSIYNTGFPPVGLNRNLPVPGDPKDLSAAETVVSQATQDWQNWLHLQMVIRAVSVSSDYGTLYAVTSHVRKDGTRDRMLWMMSRTQKGLRITDWEDLSCGFTGRLQVAIEYLLNNETGIVRAHDYGVFLRLRDATRNMRQVQYAGNGYLLGDAARLLPVGQFADFLGVCEALFQLKGGTPYNAAVILDALVDRYNHPLSAELIRARAGVKCDNAKVALVICSEARVLFGNDPDLLLTEALAHEQLGDRELAEQKYQAALREEPSHFDALKAYLAFLPPGKKEPFEKLFFALPKPELYFDSFARDLEEKNDWAALLHFAEAFQKLKPKDDRPFRYLIAANVELNKPDAAIAAYRAAIAKKTGWQRNSLRDMFYNRMALKYPEKAYTSATTNDERTLAFQILTRNLLAEQDDETEAGPAKPTLKNIIAQHKKAVPNDRLIAQVEGELAFQQKR